MVQWGIFLFLQEQLYFTDLVVFFLYPLVLTVSPVLPVLDLVQLSHIPCTYVGFVLCEFLVVPGMI
jgi:hypothetical protein